MPGSVFEASTALDDEDGRGRVEVASRMPHNAELEPVLNLIRSRSLRTLSLDVFDTLLWRRVPAPSDLFAVIAERLRVQGLLASWVTDSAFVALRERIEAIAREERGLLGSEISLSEIWARMPRDLFGGVPVELLVDAEMAVEREFTVVDLDTAALVAAARASGIAIVLVSDTYFDDAQLRFLLDRPELDLGPDVRLFRSVEYGSSKAEELWPAVLNGLGQAPEEIVHVGDNREADDEVPSRFGVRTVHYERVDDEFGKVLARERRMPSAGRTLGAHVDPRHGDLGLTTLRARAVGAAGRGARRIDAARRFGAGVFGPVLTGFAEWVAVSCAERGVRTVWCPMREGELLSDLINRAARARGLDVVARPLWLSRSVAWMATVDELDADLLEELIAKSYDATVRNLLDSLALSPGDVPALAAHLDRVLEDHEFIDQVAAALIEAPHLRHRLASAAVGRRRRLVRALRAAGALDDPELVLIDLGWGATIQLQLAQALGKAGVDVVPSGMYLASDHRSMRLLTRGLRVEGYLGAAGEPRSVVDRLIRSPEGLELCVNAVCGSLQDFTEDGEPVLGPVVGTEDQHAERRAVQEGIRAFQARWHAYAAVDPSWPMLTEEVARDRLGEVMRAALAAPTEAEASLFGMWAHEDNLGSDFITRIAPDDLLEFLPYLSPQDLADLPMRDAFWPAVIAPFDTGLAASVRALAAGDIEPAAFEQTARPLTADEVEPAAVEQTERPFARMVVHTEDDRWMRGAEHRVRINHNGLSFARFSLPTRLECGPDEDLPTRIVEASLVLDQPAIIRVDRVHVRLRTIDGEVQHHRWESPADFAGFGLVDATWLGGNLFELRTEKGALVLPLAGRAGRPVSSGRITLAFAMLPQSPSGLAPAAREASGAARISGRLLEQFEQQGVRGIVSQATRGALRRMVDRS